MAGLHDKTLQSWKALRCPPRPWRTSKRTSRCASIIDCRIRTPVRRRQSQAAEPLVGVHRRESRSTHGDRRRRVTSERSDTQMHQAPISGTPPQA